MPLDQDIKGGHGESESCVEILPDPVHDLLEVTDECQHREHGLHQHAVIPRAALTEFEGAGIPLRGMEGGIAQDDHPFFELANQPLNWLRVLVISLTA